MSDTKDPKNQDNVHWLPAVRRPGPPKPPGPPDDVEIEKIDVLPQSWIERNVNSVLHWWFHIVRGIVLFVLMPLIAPAYALISAILSFPLNEKWENRLKAWEQGINEWVVRRVQDTWGLKSYGDSGFNTRVRRDIKRNNIVLSLLFCFLWFAWWATWSYTDFPWVVRALLLPTAFATVEIFIERMILVLPDKGGKDRWKVIASRTAGLLLAATLTSIPVVLGIMGPEIHAVIADQKQANIAAIQEKAIAQEKAIIDKQLTVNGGLLSESAKADAARRAAELARYEAQRDAIQKQFDQLGDELKDEISGGKFSSQGAGNGPAARALREQRDAIKVELDAANARIDAFVATTAEQTAEGAANGLKEQQRLATAFDEKTAEIRAMTGDQLVAEYGTFGLEYEVADGFLARYGILLELVASSFRNKMIYLGCELLMIVFQLGIMFLRYKLSSPETEDYYSPYKQALMGHLPSIVKMLEWSEHGDDEAKKAVRLLAIEGHPAALERVAVWTLGGDADARKVVMLRAMIPDDRAVGTLQAYVWQNPSDVEAKNLLGRLGYESNVVRLTSEASVHRSRLLELRQRLDGKLIRFRRYVEGLDTRVREGSLIREDLDTQAQAEWENRVLPFVHEVVAQEEYMAGQGMAIPGWPVECGEGDPRKQVMVWDMPDTDLARWLGRPVLVATAS